MGTVAQNNLQYLLHGHIHGSAMSQRIGPTACRPGKQDLATTFAIERQFDALGSSYLACTYYVSLAYYSCYLLVTCLLYAGKEQPLVHLSRFYATSRPAFSHSYMP